MVRYTEAFFLITLTPIIAVNLGFLIWFAIWSILLRIQKRRYAFGDAVEIADIDGKTTPVPVVEEQPSKGWITPLWWVDTWIWLVIYTLLHLGCSLVAFDFLPIGAGIPIFLIFGWISWVVMMPPPPDKDKPSWFDGDWKHKAVVYHRYLWWKIKNRYILFSVVFVIMFLAIFLPYFFFEGTCIASDPYEFSSRYTRSRSRKFCDTDEPCNIYLTMTEEPSNSIFVNFHSGDQEISSEFQAKVYYDTVSHKEDSNANNYGMSIDGKTNLLDMRDFHRTIHFAYLTGLSPNTTYFFRVGYRGISAEKSFRTLPASGPLTFIAGGDMGVSLASRTLMEHSQDKNPAFAMVGGDIAYENGMRACYRRWDDWFYDWDKYMIDQAGNQIQMLLSLGNHEGGGWGTGRSLIPYWFDLFPQNGDGNLKDRMPYHSHRISDHTFVMVLDSGVDVLVDDPGQLKFIRDSFDKFSGYKNSLAIYHAPLYPGFRPYETTQSVDARTHWGPIFDQFKLTCGFENHDHIYKRSKRLRDGIETADGTLYVGDGTWGVTIRPSAEKRWYLDQVFNENFVLSVVASSSSLNISSVGIEGQIFDQCDI